MSEMEEKLGAILNNPQLMQQIVSMAQSIGNSQSQAQQDPPPQEKPAPAIDPRILQAVSGIAQQNGVDQNQQALLKALSPFLSRGRINKLERAMRASKMAGMASSFLNAGGLQMLTGR